LFNNKFSLRGLYCSELWIKELLLVFPERHSWCTV